MASKFLERLFWPLIVCRECDGHGERYYPRWLSLEPVWRFPGGLYTPMIGKALSKGLLPDDTWIDVKREPCRLCRGTGRLWRRGRVSGTGHLKSPCTVKSGVSTS